MCRKILNADLYRESNYYSNANDSSEIALNIYVSDKTAQNDGVNEPWKMTRLKWLNSNMAQENTVIKPYTPLSCKKQYN